MSRLVSIFIPTYNGEDYIGDCLNAVNSQILPSGWDKEVLVTDSSSTDSTRAIIESQNSVKLRVISKDQFQHGRTRNEAAKLAKGEIVVYLTQDAIPASNRWLSYMIEPFLLNEAVVGVCGMQIPRPYAPITIKREVSSVFSSLGPPHSLMIHRLENLFDGTVSHPLAIGFMSDVNAAYRTSYLLQRGFKDINYAEDQQIGNDIIQNDKLIKVYTPFGSVIHSNDYGPWEYFYRKVDERIGLYQSLGVDSRIGKKAFLKSIISNTLKDTRFTVHDKEIGFTQKLNSILYLNLLYNLSAARAAYPPIDKLMENKNMSLEGRQHKRHNHESRDK